MGKGGAGNSGGSKAKKRVFLKGSNTQQWSTPWKTAKMASDTSRGKVRKNGGGVLWV